MPPLVEDYDLGVEIEDLDDDEFVEGFYDEFDDYYDDPWHDDCAQCGTDYDYDEDEEDGDE